MKLDRVILMRARRISFHLPAVPNVTAAFHSRFTSTQQCNYIPTLGYLSRCVPRNKFSYISIIAAIKTRRRTAKNAVIISSMSECTVTRIRVLHVSVEYSLYMQFNFLTIARKSDKNSKIYFFTFAKKKEKN